MYACMYACMHSSIRFIFFHCVIFSILAFINFTFMYQLIDSFFHLVFESYACTDLYICLSSWSAYLGHLFIHLFTCSSIYLIWSYKTYTYTHTHDHRWCCKTVYITDMYLDVLLASLLRLASILCLSRLLVSLSWEAGLSKLKRLLQSIQERHNSALGNGPQRKDQKILKLLQQKCKCLCHIKWWVAYIWCFLI